MLINVHEKLNYLINNSAEKVKFLSDINNFIISKGNATLENECLIIPDITIGTGASSVIFQTSKSFETDDKKTFSLYGAFNTNGATRTISIQISYDNGSSWSNLLSSTTIPYAKICTKLTSGKQAKIRAMIVNGSSTSTVSANFHICRLDYK